MGREIRRVPLDWEHPLSERGGYEPLFDNDYETVALEWEANYRLWQEGKHPDQLGEKWGNFLEEHNYRFFWEWDSPPNKDSYRERKWTEAEAVGYQIYETVTEGTPKSPVFESLDDMVDWLIKEGYSEEAAVNFATGGWAPSMSVSIIAGSVSIKSDIESLE